VGTRQEPKMGTVNGCPWLEVVSSAADGELATAADQAAALAHAQRCRTCSSILTMSPALVAANSGAATVKAAPVSIDRSAFTAQERRWLNGKWNRRLLMIAAVTIVVEGVPRYISGGLTAEAYAARHVASWQIGFGVGLFVAAWITRMSSALLAFAATLGLLTIISKSIDVLGGHHSPWANWVHLIELVAVVLLWRLTPPHLLPWTRRTPTDDPNTQTSVVMADITESTIRDSPRLRPLG
jgi:hypothetical protein